MCFFFSSRRRHTRCSRDWSSDVCSSDLYQTSTLTTGSSWFSAKRARSPFVNTAGGDYKIYYTETGRPGGADRKRGVEGKRGDFGGRRIIKKKKRENTAARAV